YPSCNEGTCPTRMGQMKAVMQQFLQSNGRVARMGLTIFPHDNVCAPSQDLDQKVAITPASDSDTDLQTWATGINTEAQPTQPSGGTRTGQSLTFAGSQPELNDPQREDFILLLTDGLPNCNTSNPNTCTAPATCKCTLNGGNCGTTVNDSDPNNF